MSAGPSEPLSDRWRYVTPALGFLALAALVAYLELSRILSALHLPGEGSYGISSLANLGFHKPHSSTPRLVFDTWDHAGFFGDLHPDQIVRLAMYVDFGFLVLYSALFALWLVHVGRGIVSVEDDAATIDRHAERRARQKTGGARASGEEFEHARRIVSARIATYVSVVKLALVAVPLLALADFLENVFTLEIANSDGKDGFWPLWTFALIKTLLFLFVAASAAIVTLALVSLRAERRLRFASGHFAI